MQILTQLNKITTDLKALLPEVSQLDVEIRSEIQTILQDAVETLTNAGALIEQYSEEKVELDRIAKDLVRRMDADKLYSGLDSAVKQRMAERVIENPNLELLNAEKFAEYVISKLRKLDDEALALQAFGKKQLVEIGTKLSAAGTNDKVKYDLGMDAVLKSLETPSGREEALSYGEKRILESPQLKTKFTYEYYGF